ncbi:hypothetical protein [Desulfonema magnum]|uniref:Uncharacterized protein n=1 Tax=Desulfonema magnum TaxID=45655 RepID=A0A975BXS4_9BACT|nr:hypothetical protein [Desulfonema magnum]QTA93467.1 Uncharacterized protein dnm_095680 [Desulfonema magnum]
MSFSAIDRIIEEFHLLSWDDKEYVANVMIKQLAELGRERVARRAAEAKANFDKGRVKTGTIRDLYEDLEDD